MTEYIVCFIIMLVVALLSFYMGHRLGLDATADNSRKNFPMAAEYKWNLTKENPPEELKNVIGIFSDGSAATVYRFIDKSNGTTHYRKYMTTDFKTNRSVPIYWIEMSNSINYIRRRKLINKINSNYCVMINFM